MDTIYALATARGRSGVAVVRISGPRAHQALALICDPPPLRVATLRKLVWHGDVLDEALVLTFDQASFTGEPSVELHLHGSNAVVARVLQVLSDMDGLRMAEAGEFTRRALENGKLDLTQVEGLADLIDADTEAQRKQAVRVLSGAIGRKVEGWRQNLLRAAALIEATIDFADEDVPVDVVPEVRDLIDAVLPDLHKETASAISERIRDGFEVAILGAPNAGKSTLLNALAGRDAAIISDIAGTTRDIIEVKMDIAGFAVTLLDTAGLRETDDVVESIGVSRAISRAAAADLRIFLLQSPDEVLLTAPLPDDLVYLGKADLQGGQGISGKTGQGLDDLIERIGQILEQRTASAGILIRERHRIAVQTGIAALTAAKSALPRAGEQPELIAAELRVALNALEALLGRVDVEMLLGEIFSSFCIGK
jgi:tRNA modification GTPase